MHEPYLSDMKLSRKLAQKVFRAWYFEEDLFEAHKVRLCGQMFYN